MTSPRLPLMLASGFCVLSVLALEGPPEPLALPVFLAALLLDVLGAPAIGGGRSSWSLVGYTLLGATCGWAWATAALALGAAISFFSGRASLVGVLTVCLPAQAAFIVGALARRVAPESSYDWPLVVVVLSLGSMPMVNWMAGYLPEKAAGNFRKEQAGMVLPRLGAAVLGACLSLVEPPSAALIGLLGVALMQSLFMLTAVDVSDRWLLKQRLSGTEKILSETAERLEDREQNLSLQRRVHRLYNELSSTLLSKSSRLEVVDASLKALRHLSGAKQLAFFTRESNRLVLKHCLGRTVDPADVALAGLSEPLVEKAAREGRVVTGQSSEVHRIFPEDRHGLAVPVADMGVLYLGFPEKAEFATDALMLVLTVAGITAISLKVIGDLEERNRALDVTEASRQTLSRWLKSLTLVSGSGLDKASDPKELQAQVADLLGELLPRHRFCCGRLTELPQEAGLASLVRPLIKSGRPLLVDELARTRFATFFPESQSLLAVPVSKEGDFLLLTSEVKGQFNRYHQELTMMVAGQMRAALQRLQTQSAHLEASKKAGLGQLAAGLSHELNNPLGAVMLHLESCQLLLEKAPDRAAASLDKAQAAIERADRILKSLLFFATHYGLELEPVNLEELLTSLLQAYPTINFELQLESDLPTLKGYAVDLKECIEQLLQNAVEATRELPEPRIRVGLQQVDQQLLLKVEDNGAGIDSEIASRVFEPFFTTKPVGHGLGLGLSVASRIAELHGGSLGVTASELGGAGFLLTLPLAKSY